ncbi:hypothetical protein [Frankia sp. BMG5.23]|uniref:hypothetical protein n=1 Tax=Frankia sp. BMG5.23 TaxID=683305 RepID=UPI000460EF63|nr:hypothetical protein [Frankia sp. BMG5.23]KDA44971.1 hypothetical protein BMG523Draft_00096 [Frankia sp. BMG5.23]
MTHQAPHTTAATRMHTRTDLIASMRAEAARCDSQVGIILAGATAGVGFVVTSWPPAGLPPPVAALWWAGVGAAVAGIAVLGRALCPAIPRRSAPPAGAYHCWHVRAAAEAGVLGAVLDRTPTALDAADRQVTAIADVVVSKWAWNRTGLRLLGTALVLLAAAGVVGQAVAR